MFKRVSILFLLSLTLFQANCVAQQSPDIFPLPLEMQAGNGQFVFDSSVFIVLSTIKNGKDDILQNLLSNELVDKYGIRVEKLSKLQLTERDKFILIGSISDPMVKSYCQQKKLLPLLQPLGDEGYILSVTKNNVLVAANTPKGALFGLSSLRQIIYKGQNTLHIPGLLVKDKPKYPFRGIKLYLPGKENFQFFKRFIKDFVALYKYNTIILELNANMRLDKHPELNEGAVEFAKHLKYSRLDRPPGWHKEYQNSSHQDNADGEIIEKTEVAGLVNYMRQFNIEVIPELPSLTHSYYLLAGHEELAENMSQPYPDTYCPLKPGSYQIYFDVLDEYIDVIHPSMVHVGHDEWRMEKDLCVLCRGKDYGQLYADDLKKIHDHLAAKGIKTAIWGDHLLESVTEHDHQTWKSSSGYTYKIPGALRPEQVKKLIPKDILIFNWFWNDVNNDKQLSDFGFRQVYGNMRTDFNSWKDRDKIAGVIGGAPSSWAGTTELNFGKDQLYDFLGCANLLWSTHYLSPDSLSFAIEPMIQEIYTDLRGKKLPVDDGALVLSLDISASCNAFLSDKIKEVNKNELFSTIKTTKTTFFPGADRKNILIPGNAANAIPVHKDVSSVLFLHACTEEALNNKAYEKIYNFYDTAEPLGFYEITYEDGLVETIPIRYGLNILDYQWRSRISGNGKEKGKYSQNKYAYEAKAVECSKNVNKPVTFFEFEWENPRYGKAIKEISLKPVQAGTGAGSVVMLLAISVSENRKETAATGVEAQ